MTRIHHCVDCKRDFGKCIDVVGLRHELEHAEKLLDVLHYQVVMLIDELDDERADEEASAELARSINEDLFKGAGANGDDDTKGSRGDSRLQEAREPCSQDARRTCGAVPMKSSPRKSGKEKLSSQERAVIDERMEKVRQGKVMSSQKLRRRLKPGRKRKIAFLEKGPGRRKVEGYGPIPIFEEAFLSKFHEIAEKISLDAEVEGLAENLFIGMMKAGRQRRSMIKGIIAACLYSSTMILGYKRTMREVADASGVTETTLRKHYYSKHLKNLREEAARVRKPAARPRKEPHEKNFKPIKKYEHSAWFIKKQREREAAKLKKDNDYMEKVRGEEE